ncbi:helix-turn-helix domain-containing protein [archaeon]|nr:helix-turn-helix domain-containing protein [archaeon]
MKDSLLRIGFTKIEAEIYLQLIKRGSLTAIDIAKETKIHRRTIYDNLNILANKGFVVFFSEKGVKYFQANSPDILKKNEEEKMLEIDSILPVLNEYFSNQMKNPCVEILRGTDAVKTIIYEMEKARGKIYWIGGGFNILNMLDFKRKQLVEKLSSLDIRTIQPKPRDNEYKKYFSNFKIKFVHEKNSTGVALFIYGDVVVTGNLVNDDFFAVKINDPEIAKTYKSIFELLWNSN